jgi:hypothetical protein
LTSNPAGLSVFRLIAEELNGGEGGPARAKFLAEAALVSRAAGAIGAFSHSRIEQAVAAIERELRSFRHMALADNSLRAADLLYPYAALSGRIEPIPFYEIRLDAFARRTSGFADRPGYKCCEDKFILYMAGRGRLPAFCDADWPRFARRVHDFNAEHCYWFTHRYLYATDMGEADIGIDWVAPAMLLIVAKAAQWGDPDLFFEAAFCVLSTHPEPQWVFAVDALSETLLPNLLAKASDNMRDVYHELFLYSLFRMRRESLGLSPAASDDGSVQALTGLVDALLSKSPDKIAAGFFAAQPLCRHPFVAEICLEKLEWLKDVALTGSLFDNEALRSEAEPAPDLYAEYLKKVDGAAAAICFAHGIPGTQYPISEWTFAPVPLPPAISSPSASPAPVRRPACRDSGFPASAALR